MPRANRQKALLQQCEHWPYLNWSCMFLFFVCLCLYLCAYSSIAMHIDVCVVSLSLGEVWKTKSWLSAVNNEPAAMPLCSRTCAVGHLSRRSWPCLCEPSEDEQDVQKPKCFYRVSAPRHPTRSSSSACSCSCSCSSSYAGTCCLILNPGLAARVTAQLFACIVVVMPTPNCPFHFCVPFYLV